MNKNYQEIAAQLALAEQKRIGLPPLSETYPELTVEQAYAIQNAWYEMKLAGQAHLIGRKNGSIAKQAVSRAVREDP